MEQKIIFGKWEGTSLVLTMMTTKVVLNYPRANAEMAGTAGWLLAVYSGFIALIGFLLIAKLYAPFHGKDLVDVAELAGGKIAKFLMGIIVVVFFIYIVAGTLRQFGEQMKTMAFERSPISYIIFLFAIGTVISAYTGLEPIIRFQAILVPVSIIAFLLYLVILAPYFDYTNILPIFGNGVYNLLVNGTSRVSEFSELLILFLITPYLKRYTDFKASGWMAIALSTFFMTTLTAAYLLMFSYPSSLLSFLPAFELGRLINFSRFFQRAESILVITWATMGYMYLSGGFYFIVYTFAKTFGMKHYKPLIPSFGIILFTLSLLPVSLMQTVSLVVKYFRTYSWIVTFVFPVVLLLLARRKLRKCKPKMEAE